MHERLTLLDKQKIFMRNVAALIMWCDNSGYGVTGGGLLRTKRQAQCNADAGIGIRSSLHTISLAIDLHLFLGNEYLKDSVRYTAAGKYWESLHVLNRWGGYFKSRRDGNHFSMEHEGIQ